MSTAITSGMKGRERKKIEIKKIIKKSNLQVTFSRRHKGLFKKASELVTLCGVELAIIIFSPSGKPLSFGHPSVADVIQRDLFQAPPPTSETMRYIQALRDAKVRELKAQLSFINNQLDAGKKHGEELKRLHKEAHAQFWWAIQVEDMNKPQLEKFRAALYEVKEHVTSYAAADVTNPPPHQIFDDVGGPSNVMVPVHHPPLPPHQAFQQQFDDVGGPSNIMVPVHHPPLPPHQAFQQQFFFGPMPHAHHLFGFNDMGGYGGPPGFF